MAEPALGRSAILHEGVVSVCLGVREGSWLRRKRGDLLLRNVKGPLKRSRYRDCCAWQDENLHPKDLRIES